MTNKEAFIKEIQTLIDCALDCQEMPFEGLTPEAQSFFDSLKQKKEITENGQKILTYMEENVNKFNNIFKAKDIGEGLSISSRAASGSLRKLVSDGFVSKIKGEPTIYKLPRYESVDFGEINFDQ